MPTIEPVADAFFSIDTLCAASSLVEKGRYKDLTDLHLGHLVLYDNRAALRALEKRTAALNAPSLPPAAPAQPSTPAKRPREERLAKKQLPPLDDSQMWKSVADPGFGDALDRAVKTWLTHPERLTSYDLSALKAVDPKYAARALKDRTDPSADDYDMSDDLERDLFLTDLFARMVHANFAVVRFRDMQHDARLKALENLSSAVGAPEVSGAAQQRIAELETRIKQLESRPTITYVGTWNPSTKYLKGNVATWDGSLWHAHVDNVGTKPGATPNTWQLCVKRGSDGRDLR